MLLNYINKISTTKANEKEQKTTINNVYEQKKTTMNNVYKQKKNNEQCL